MGKDFTVRVCDPERKAEWEEVLGTATVHIKSPFPRRANLPGHPGALIYELDLDFLTEFQRQRLIAHLAARFGLLESAVAADLGNHGVPILANNCVVTVADPIR